MKKEKINTTMDKDLLKMLKILAIEEGKRLNDVLEEACISYLKSKGKEVKM